MSGYSKLAHLTVIKLITFIEELNITASMLAFNWWYSAPYLPTPLLKDIKHTATQLYFIFPKRNILKLCILQCDANDNEGI